jgi:hypothetical protein
MLRTAKLFAMRWKSCIRKPYVWAFVVIAILAAAIPAWSSQFIYGNTLPIGLVNEDGDALSEKLYDYMSDYSGDLTIYQFDREKSLRYLAMGRLEAVYIINDGFTEHLIKGQYENVITMYTAPASSAALALSETVINSTIIVWLEEKSLMELETFLLERGLVFTDDEKSTIRNNFDERLKRGSMVVVTEHIPDPPQTVGRYKVLLDSTAWYAAFSLLFVIISAGWVVETRRLVLGERMRTAGINPISALLGSALSIILISMMGWFIADLIATIILESGFLISLHLVLPMLLYMVGSMGVTLVISSLLGNTMQLMLVAPVFTITQGVLCGMLITLPKWADVLVYLSYVLPGRWLMLSGDALLHGGNIGYVAGQAACAFVWLVVGAFAVIARSSLPSVHRT